MTAASTPDQLRIDENNIDVHVKTPAAGFGARAAALAGLVAPAVMVVGGIASHLLQQDATVANTTCCPFL